MSAVARCRQQLFHPSSSKLFWFPERPRATAEFNGGMLQHGADGCVLAGQLSGPGDGHGPPNEPFAPRRDAEACDTGTATTLRSLPAATPAAAPASLSPLLVGALSLTTVLLVLLSTSTWHGDAWRQLHNACLHGLLVLALLPMCVEQRVRRWNGGAERRRSRRERAAAMRRGNPVRHPG